jgi:hypothetical protein
MAEGEQILVAFTAAFRARAAFFLTKKRRRAVAASA